MEIEKAKKYGLGMVVARNSTPRGIEQYAREGKDCPSGLIIARQGNTITDPHKILQALVQGKAALVPIGGIKESDYSRREHAFWSKNLQDYFQSIKIGCT